MERTEKALYPIFSIKVHRTSSPAHSAFMTRKPRHHFAAWLERTHRAVEESRFTADKRGGPLC